MERIDTFDFPYAMNSYQILVNLSTSNSRLDCPSGTVAFIAYCGKYYTFYFIFNCLNNVISIILQIIIVQRLQRKSQQSLLLFFFLSITVPCSIGSYYSEEECKLCPLGSYQDTSSQTYCIACPSRTTTEGTGSIAETDCCGEFAVILFVCWK